MQANGRRRGYIERFFTTRLGNAHLVPGHGHQAGADALPFVAEDPGTLLGQITRFQQGVPEAFRLKLTMTFCKLEEESAK